MKRLIFSALQGISTGARRRRPAQRTRRLLCCESLEPRLLLSVTADFNGDGYADLAIGSPGETTSKGVVNVIYGSAAGLTEVGDQLWSQDSSLIEGVANPGDRFGAALAAGDFNGDGYADLAIGVPGEDVNGMADAGAVNVIYGTPAGLTATRNFGPIVLGDQLWTQDSTNIADSAEPGDQFGASLTVGDFNGDGIDDLAIGVPLEDFSGNDAGGVNVLYGSAIVGLVSSGNQFWSKASPGISGVAARNQLFGFALAAGDFNGDGRDDLAVGAPAATNSAGSGVSVIFGSTTGLSASGNQLKGVFIDRSFGTSLAAGDFDHDGFEDLVVGDPEDRLSSFGGLIIVFFGGPQGIDFSATNLGFPNSAVILTDLMPITLREEGDHPGQVLTVGDFNGDGADDVAAGVPLEDVGAGENAGQVLLFYGSPSTQFALDLGILDQAVLPGQSAESFDRFGAALAADDFDGDGFSDLVIGVPGENAGRGIVHVVYGDTNGLTGASQQQIWSQDTFGIIDASEAGDQFGAGLVSSPAPIGAGFSGNWLQVTQHGRGNVFTLHGVIDVFNPASLTAANSVVRFYLSSDPLLDDSDLLVSEKKLAPLRASAHRRLVLNEKLNSSASGMYLIAELDAEDAVAEVNEENNIVVFGPVP